MIAKDADLQKKMKSSITQNPSDYELPIVRASLRETLRLYPVAPFVGRLLDCDTKIGDYIVPENYMALMSFYTSGRDPANFSNSLAFAPDRWLRDSKQTEYQVLNPFGSLPFAIGMRSCVGKKVVTYQTHCLITKVKLHIIKISVKLKMCFSDSPAIHSQVIEQG